MTASGPRVSIGLPVFNGERFIAATVEALLGQSFTDFELIISDNASDDRTVPICEDLARRDGRVRLLRQGINLGSVANFNRVLDAAVAPLFKWAAHDDLHAPQFVERCVAMLEQRPDAVLAYTRARSVDTDGRTVRGEWGDRPELASPDVVTRFRAALAPARDPLPLPMFGVMRTDAVRRTGRLVPGPDYDRALLAELVLQGPFVEVAEPLFGQREHGQREGRVVSADARRAARLLGGSTWLPHWALLRRHLASVARRPVGVEASRLVAEVGRWAVRQRCELAGDLVHGLTGVPIVGEPIRAGLEWGRLAAWRRRRGAVTRRLDGVLPADAEIVVVDDDELGLATIGGRACTPIDVRNGVSWGFPGTAADAIVALAARRQEGATHLAVLWPAEWVMEYHLPFAEHLEREHRLVVRGRDLAVYELLGRR